MNRDDWLWEAERWRWKAAAAIARGTKEDIEWAKVCERKADACLVEAERIGQHIVEVEAACDPA